MTLSQDACCTIDWYPAEQVAAMAPNWHMTYVLDEIVPALKEAGLTQDQVDLMMVEAPRRWLA
jgi:phosphotriesterase-related protein